MRTNKIWAVFLFSFSLLPALNAYLASQLTPLLVSRGFIWASIPLIILITTAVCSINNKWLKIGVLIFLIALNIKGDITYFRDFHKERWDLVAEHIAKNYQQGDGIFISASYLKKALDYYIKKENISLVVNPLVLDKESLDITRKIPLQQYKDRYHRLWLVRSHLQFEDPDNNQVSTLKQIMVNRSMHKFLRSGYRADCGEENCINVYLFESQKLK